MIRYVLLAFVFTMLALPCHAQELLKTKGFGKLSGKITLEGDVPAEVNLVPLMMQNPDAKVCCAPGAQVVDQKWVVDKKTKGVANVVVWVMPPKDMYFEIDPKFKVRKEKIVIDQPHCAFLPYVTAYNPSYFNGKELVATGQELILKNSAAVPHNVRAVADGKINDGFNINVPAKTEFNATTDLAESKRLKAQLMPVSIQCDIHRWMSAKLYVFDHPYYAITKADGSYEIPNVPAGAEVILMVHHGEAGWVLPELKKGRAITVKDGKTTTMDFTIKAPK
jgi:hypothetical protein